LRDKVSIEEILQGELILREKGSGTREIFENKLQGSGYDINSFNPYMELGSIPAIKSLVEENLGYTIISKETIKRELKNSLSSVT
jgi:molybdate-binding protein